MGGRCASCKQDPAKQGGSTESVSGWFRLGISAVGDRCGQETGDEYGDDHHRGPTTPCRQCEYDHRHCQEEQDQDEQAQVAFGVEQEAAHVPSLPERGRSHRSGPYVGCGHWTCTVGDGWKESRDDRPEFR